MACRIGPFMKHYYKFSADGTYGKLLTEFWRQCQRADQRAERFASKMGAVAYHTSPVAFAGGVAYLVFPQIENADGEKVDRVDHEQWRLATVLNGENCYEPNVRQTTGCVVLDNERFRPSDTGRRVYQRKYHSFKDVSNVYSVRKWFEVAGIHYDPTLSKELLIKVLQKRIGCKRFLLYNEYTGMSDCPRSAKRAARAEVFRSQLPIVMVEDFYRIFRVDMNKVSMHADTPTFFIYQGDYYISLDAVVDGTHIEEITQQTYMFCMNRAKNPGTDMYAELN